MRSGRRRRRPHPRRLRRRFLRFLLRPGFLFRRCFRVGNALQVLANFLRNIFRNRARVGLFFGDAVARQKVDDGLGLDLQLARQLIDAYLICFRHAPR
jgi:hypothetical protein